VGEVKTTFTAEQMSSRSKFKPRVLAVLSGTIWSGNDHQLETFIKRKTERLREVKPSTLLAILKNMKPIFLISLLCIKVKLSTKISMTFKTGNKN
jgi:hypothetical protein